jgi:hypothetical protein
MTSIISRFKCFLEFCIYQTMNIKLNLQKKSFIENSNNFIIPLISFSGSECSSCFNNCKSKAFISCSSFSNFVSINSVALALFLSNYKRKNISCNIEKRRPSYDIREALGIRPLACARGDLPTLSCQALARHPSLRSGRRPRITLSFRA